MVSLVEFLTARLDEDEAVAREAVLMRDRTEFAPGHEPEVPDMSAWANDDVLGGAVVSVGPERVLAEVEAKRRIVEQHAHFERTFTGDEYQDGMAAGYGDVVKLLALPYADHPDYDEAWRP